MELLHSSVDFLFYIFQLTFPLTHKISEKVKSDTTKSGSRITVSHRPFRPLLFRLGEGERNCQSFHYLLVFSSLTHLYSLFPLEQVGLAAWPLESRLLDTAHIALFGMCKAQ